MIVLKCRYLTRDNLCSGKYSGYGCIQKQCSLFKEAQQCEFHEPSGDYCKKYGRFGCVGRDSCATLVSYLEAVAETE